MIYFMIVIINYNYVFVIYLRSQLIIRGLGLRIAILNAAPVAQSSPSRAGGRQDQPAASPCGGMAQCNGQLGFTMAEQRAPDAGLYWIRDADEASADVSGRNDTVKAGGSQVASMAGGAPWCGGGQ